MSKSIQPTLHQSVQLKNLCNNILHVADHNPPDISRLLSKVLKCYVATMPHDALDAVHSIGKVQYLLASISNHQRLLSFGCAYFENMAEELEEKEGGSC